MFAVGQLDLAMQQAAASTLETRQVKIIPLGDDKLAENCVAVVPPAINCIFPVSEMGPDTIS